jgi:hypothetical protein
VRGSSKRACLVAIVLTLLAAVAAPVASSAATKVANKGGGDIVPPVFAATASLPTAMAGVQALLTARLTDLHQLSVLVAKSKTLTNSDQDALTSLIDSDASGLGLLEVSVTTAQSVAALNADAAQVVLNYHVFSLATPVVKDVISTDRSIAQSRALVRQIPEIEATVSASSLRAQSKSQAASLLAQLSNRLAGVQSVLAGVVPVLLAIAPSSVPASLPSLSAATSATRTAATDIQSADAIVAQITAIIAGPAKSSHARR